MAFEQNRNNINILHKWYINICPRITFCRPKDLNYYSYVTTKHKYLNGLEDKQTLRQINTHVPVKKL